MDLGDGAEAKIKRFQNMVMLHIKLKLMTLAATWWVNRVQPTRTCFFLQREFSFILMHFGGCF